MDGPLRVGRRVITRTFEGDRYSGETLAEAFKQLNSASTEREPRRDSVQVRNNAADVEPQLQEAIQ